jgi:nucleotide-binding universal stress UspA family protein
VSESRNAVVVGTKGAGASRSAIVHGVTEAQRRHVPLLLLHTWSLPPLVDGSEALVLHDVEEAEASVLTDSEALAHELAPGLEVRTRLAQGSAGEELVQASEDAALVVVGRMAEHRAWLGHVLGRLSSAAGCPVLTVPDDAPEPDDGLVVVGVNGSACSMEAVAFAFAEAESTGSALRAVLAVELGLDAYVPDPALLEQVRDRGRRELSESLAGWGDRHTDVHVEQVVELGAPVTRLREAGRDARLVVVGSHGRGFLGRHLFGSVSSALLRDAPCPVAVVRGR